MEYNFKDIEKRAKDKWAKDEVYKVSNESSKPKCYVLDMFPYPSGAGLHVGHPLGYIASDIYARYKRLCGYNVLHPMGYDAFGLPAEQYAIETGQHPAVTTEKNIARYREQLDNIGFCYDWDREVRTSDPKYYKWTQWLFLQLFHSWYDRKANKARPISELIAIFEEEGNVNHACPGDETMIFDADDWENFTETEKREHLMHYRIAFQGNADVWWCEALGTVLANDEVVNGVSERGGHPVERKQMRQWFLRITEYADRLLKGLDNLDWSEAMKEMQKNWIGKSSGAIVHFDIDPSPALPKGEVAVFTTRPDTIFGADFLVLAPEHELVESITTEAQADAVAQYIQYVKSRSERERMSEVKTVTGCFTGAYAIHPFTGKQLPIWISEYVLAGYGTGAIMAVPSGDDRDHAFAKHFNIPITNVFGDQYNGEEAFSSKTGTIENSDFLSGMQVPDAIEAAITAIEQKGIGKRKVNYRLRDAGFSRQRYWGEPFPIIYKDGVPYGIDEFDPSLSLPEGEGDVLGNDITKPIQNDTSLPFGEGWGGVCINHLPVELPHVDSYSPGPEGQGPLANIKEWVNISLPFGEGRGEVLRETNTMPGYAGSSWYFLRYMDPHNDHEFASREAIDYWGQADVYIGGAEHAVGHLLYARMWTKVMYDLGLIGFDEPFKKLLNQGMIQGNSRFVFEVIISNAGSSRFGRIFVSKSHYEKLKKIENSLDSVIEYMNSVCVENNWIIREGTTVRIIRHHIDVNLVDGVELRLNDFKEKFNINEDSGYLICEEDGTYICDTEIEKMSKSKHNVVNPDLMVAQYGADTFRMYEMFLGPVEMSKPWDTKGIEGVHRFLKKFWRLYNNEENATPLSTCGEGLGVRDEPPTDAELRILHKTLKKISEDIEKFSFNTSVSQFMICVNELTALNCHKRAILEPLVVALCPFAPHIAEELWHQLGHEGSVVAADFPKYEERYIATQSVKYPVAVNGKTRVEIEFPVEALQPEVEKEVLAHDLVQKWMEGKPLKKFIFVKGKMINVVV